MNFSNKINFEFLNCFTSGLNILKKPTISVHLRLYLYFAIIILTTIVLSF